MDSLHNFHHIAHIPNSNIFVQYKDDENNITDRPIDFIGIRSNGDPIFLEFDGVGNFCMAGNQPNHETNEKFWGIFRK